MGKIIFVLGGVKSGKTQWVIDRAKKSVGTVTYLATATAGDKEMKEKIKEHQKMRPQNWQTIEEPYDFLKRIKKINSTIFIVDCINFWLANILCSSSHKVAQGFPDRTGSPASYIDSLCKYLKNKNCLAYIISNEVGMNLIPTNKLGRKFQKLLGIVNQIIAQYADKVYLMVAGIPLRMK